MFCTNLCKEYNFCGYTNPSSRHRRKARASRLALQDDKAGGSFAASPHVRYGIPVNTNAILQRQPGGTREAMIGAMTITSTVAATPT